MSFLEECHQTILFSGLSPDVDAAIALLLAEVRNYLAPSAAGARRVKAQAAAGGHGRAPSRSRTQVACCATLEREQGRLMSIQQTRLSEKNGYCATGIPSQEACKTKRTW